MVSRIQPRSVCKRLQLKTVEITCEQRSPEWFAARSGCVTGSGVANVLAKIKKGEAATRRDYRTKLAVERLTGLPQENGYTNAAMQWGIEQETFARGAYEAQTDVMVRETGFIRVVDEFIGYSPDGFSNDGLLEIKCPNSVTHFEYLVANELPSEYKPQVMFGMWVNNLPYCDFVSYDPRFPEHLQLFVKRIERDEDYIQMLASEVRKFNQEVTELVAKFSREPANA